MKRAIICYISCHHNNTEKLVKEAVKGLPIDLLDISKSRVVDLSGYDIIVFASGIYYGKMHAKLIEFIHNIKLSKGQTALLMSTAGCTLCDFTGSVKRLLQDKRIEVQGTFRCKGYDTYGPLRLLGGVAKGHPDVKDIARAKAFLSKYIIEAFPTAANA